MARNGLDLNALKSFKSNNRNYERKNEGWFLFGGLCSASDFFQLACSHVSAENGFGFVSIVLRL